METYLDDAEAYTVDWQIRHSPQARSALGAMRWKGIWDNWHHIRELLDIHTTLDFGGADGPLPGCDVCDIQGERKWSRLEDIPSGAYGCVFTSHTLEHCPDLGWTLAEFERIGARSVIVHVPAWTCVRWRADRYCNPNQGTPHVHTFKLAGDDYADAVEIDTLIRSRWPCVSFSEHCGDNSILVLAAKWQRATTTGFSISTSPSAGGAQ